MAQFMTGKGAVVYKGSCICTSLLWHLAAKGYSSEEINRMVKDVFEVIREGGSFTIAIVNAEMEALGWPPSIVDEVTFEMIVGLLESELGFSVTSHTLN